MEVLKLFRQIYTGKNSFSTHVSLFSLIGIFVILFVKYTASWLNLLYSNDFFISVPSSNFELWLYLFIGTIIFIFLSGFVINLMRNVITGKSSVLPEITLLPFVYFVKALPYYLYLIGCFVAISVLGELVLSAVNIPGLDYIFASVMFCLTPFFIIMFIEFLSKMNYSKNLFNILRVFRIIELTIGEVIFFTLKMFVVSVIPVIIIYKLLLLQVPKDFIISAQAFKLAVAVIGMYIVSIYNSVYLMGLANIQKNKLNG